jgi:hypothetical protein
MQHTHVKRKEKTMNRYPMEEYFSDPARYRRLAEREQARAIRASLATLSGGLAASSATAPRSGTVARRTGPRLG